MKKMKKVIALLLALAMVLSFVACGEKKEEEEETVSKYGGEVHILRSSGTTCLCGLYKSVKADFVCPCVESLMWTDPVTQETTPYLAESWTTDENNNVTVTLQKGIMFHDGSELTAEVVKWNMDKLKENNLGSSYYNAEAEVIDTYVVKFTFSEFHLDAVSTIGSLYIYSMKAWEDNGDDYLINHPVGTGPFVFSEYIPDQSITYVRNENYWQKDADGNQLPYLDKYVEDIIAEDNSAVTAIINEDVLTALNGNQVVIDQLASNGYEDKHTDTQSNIALYGFAPNSKVEGDPWSILEVRQAVMLYGLDYEGIALLAGSSRAVNTRNLSREDSLIYSTEIESAYTYDPEKAKQMLADAGYPDGFTTTIHCVSITKAYATVLQAELAKIGIVADVDVMVNSDPKRTDGVTPGIFLLTTYMRYDLFTGCFKTIFNQTSGTNGKNIKFSDEYQAIYNAGMGATTYEERASYGRQLLQKLMVDECLFTVSYGIAPAVFINDKLHDSGADVQKYTPAITWVSE